MKFYEIFRIMVYELKNNINNLVFFWFLRRFFQAEPAVHCFFIFSFGLLCRTFFWILVPFIPAEEEIDSLIVGSATQMSTFLQMLKETGAYRCEAFKLTWTDIDFVSNTVRITPEKGSRPRIFKMSDRLTLMLNSLPKKIWQDLGLQKRLLSRQRL